MFSDAGWIPDRSDAQTSRLKEWMACGANIVAIELGAGTAIPSVRMFTERCGFRYVRINPTEPETRGKLGVGLAGSALDVLRRLAAIVQ
jgi:hypothetical protein